MSKIERRRLIVFDVEGVLVPRRRSLFFEAGRKVGFPQLAQIIFFGALYEFGLISLKSAMKHVFRIFKGLPVDELLRIFKQVPLLPGVETLFNELHNAGWKTALISSGLPTFVVRDLASVLNADYAFGFDIGIENDAATGEIWGDNIERNGKFLVLKRILETEGLTPKDCVVVADDRNNASIMLPETLKIGYNPDFIIRAKADCVVTGYPIDILSLVQNQPRIKRHPSRNDVVRECIHASGVAMPVFSSLIGIVPIVFFILFLTVLYSISELALLGKKNLPIISWISQHATTPEEFYEFRLAPIFFAFGILLVLLLFPLPASSAAIAIFAVGDSTASLFGKMFGKRPIPFNKGKTVEGSFIGFLCAFLAALFFVNPFTAALGAAVAMLLESLPLPVNDNLVLPLVTGALVTLLL